MTQSNQVSPLGDHPSELTRHYIPASSSDVKEMLEAIGLESLDQVWEDLPEGILFDDKKYSIPEELSYAELKQSMEELSCENRVRRSFLGDGLPCYKQHAIVEYVCGIRNLTTAYTPYQPERSQGSLVTHWIYQCMMSKLTGFEAINASLYDRSTAVFEAVCCSVRLTRGKNKVLVSRGLFPGDIEVLDTLVRGTGVDIIYYDLGRDTGLICMDSLKAKAEELGSSLSGIVFPQVNHWGLLEDVDQLTDFAHSLKAKAIAVIDPILLSKGGLKPPSSYGECGADVIAGEAQHIAISANCGGPGLGLFGVRYNEKVKNDIRATPGRFIGRSKDESGRDCFVIVLSTREQHIRKERATSNICSNQAFLATVAGAAILARGEDGMQKACESGLSKVRKYLPRLLRCKGVSLAFKSSPFYSECTLELASSSSEFIQGGCSKNLWVGVDVSKREDSKARDLIKISFSDIQSDEDCEALVAYFEETFGFDANAELFELSPATDRLRVGAVGLPCFDEDELKAYYDKLGELNVSPDDACYPLGSCTMKYNPFINDWAASLPGFTQAHPQAPESDLQGSLHVLYNIQEWFKGITGLPGVTTQPVAGAQGELVGLKLFQAYHKDHSKTERDIIFIPKSAHGTNFATAVTAGFAVKNIVPLLANEHGQIDVSDFEQKLAQYGDRLCGVMITNPNTSGIFESAFHLVAQRVHEVGGLVYMDGANMNAIAGWVDLDKLGVDAVHNNLHKTWTIPHGGGGPGDAIVAVSDRLLEYLPGFQVVLEGGVYAQSTPAKSIGSFHRHWGNFAHKVRCLTYLKRLGREGVRAMSVTAVLAARYLLKCLSEHYPTLPQGAESVVRMHEFILTLTPEDFSMLEAEGLNKASVIPRIGKLFLDFGFHAPTVAFPEPLGLMIEPTESYTKAQLDRFCEAIIEMKRVLIECPSALHASPRFTPIDRVDEVAANRSPIVSDTDFTLPELHANRVSPKELAQMDIDAISARVRGS